MTSAARSQGTILLGPFYTRHEAAERAQLPPSELAGRSGLIRLTGRYAVEEVYFAFQFDDAGIRSDIAEVAKRLERHLDPCHSADWLARAHSELGGKAPLDWIHSGGRLDMVLGLVNTLDAAQPAR
jgi:hypothetical protein